MRSKLSLVLTIIFMLCFGSLAFAQNMNMGGTGNMGGGHHRHHRHHRRHHRHAARTGGNANME
ncbi:MAG: hypothetical protein AUG51_11135 [Acidobacteria bacterium 13_1_20CM_3_53_8]|nr:MAG: hypothetical protein AUG51_11135 [Acidobacteria bacterium 13_1_20CM_3_53_8]